MASQIVNDDIKVYILINLNLVETEIQFQLNLGVNFCILYIKMLVLFSLTVSKLNKTAGMFNAYLKIIFTSNFFWLMNLIEKLF